VQDRALTRAYIRPIFGCQNEADIALADAREYDRHGEGCGCSYCYCEPDDFELQPGRVDVEPR